VTGQGAAFRLEVLHPQKSPLLFAPGGREIQLYINAKVNLTVGSDGTIYQDLSGENGHVSHRLSDEADRGWPWDLPMHPFTVLFDHGPLVSVTEAQNIEFESVRFFTGVDFASITATFRREGPLPEKELLSPWFTLLVAQQPEGLSEGHLLVESLNDPCQIPDTSWIIPGRVYRDLLLSTESGMASIDLASLMGWEYVLLDTGWYGPENDPSSDASKWLPQPKKAPFQLDRIIEYGEAKKVGIWLGVNDIALKRQAQELVPLYASWGIKGLKVSSIQLDSSKDVLRLWNLVRLCADHQILLNIHDYFRPSGWSRCCSLIKIENKNNNQTTKNTITEPTRT